MATMHNTPSDLIRLVEDGIKLLIEKYGVKSDCGYFAIFDCVLECFVLKCQIGINPPEKREKRFGLCQEKALRLYQNPSHKTSYQSRNPAERKYGGAVRVGNFIFSFSGIPDELDDEALMAFVAYKAGLLTQNETLSLGVSNINEHLIEIV